MTSRRVCIAAALLTLALAIAGVLTEPKCGADRGLGPVIALELSTSATEVAALVTTPQCAAALRENTYADVVAFIPAFTTFLIAGALLIGRKLAAALFALGALCDWLEDAVMLHVLSMPLPTFEWLSALFFASRLKFLVLSLGIIVLGWAVKSTARGYGLLMMAGGALALCGLPLDHRLLMPGTLIAWLALAAFALRPAR